MNSALVNRGQTWHHLARNRVGTGHPAVGIQAHDTVGLAAQGIAGPVQANHQAVGLSQHQRVLDLAGRLGHQVLEFRAFQGVNAGQVQHADAGPIRAKQGRACAGVVAVSRKKVFPPVQPHRLQFGQCRAYGRGAHAGLGQIRAYAGDQVGAGVRAVNGAADIDHHAACVREDRKVARVDNGASQTLQQGSGCVPQVLVGLKRVALVRHSRGFKGPQLTRLQPLVDAALPRSFDPGGDPARRQRSALVQRDPTCLLDAGQAAGSGLAGRQGVDCIRHGLGKGVAHGCIACSANVNHLTGIVNVGCADLFQFENFI